MITLFTGMPGAGKTAAMVDVLASMVGDRPLFVDGLEGLTLPHTPVDALKWHQELPDGAVLVVDEAQRVWRPRGPSSKVPESVVEMETHRHRGIDIFLTTQSPRLVDSNVRGLVGRHVHIRDVGWYGRWWYEWPETNEGTSWKMCPNKKRYKLPTRVFDLYTSASTHIKPVRGVPRLLYLALALVVAVVVLGFMVYRSMSARLAPAASPAAVSAGSMVARSDPLARPVQPEKRVADERVDFMPRISGRPWTAPAYDDLRQVVSVPHITGAMCIGADCRCYAGERRLLDVGSNECREWADTRPFNPYLSAESGPAVGQPQVQHDQRPAGANRPPPGRLAPSML